MDVGDELCQTHLLPLQPIHAHLNIVLTFTGRESFVTRRQNVLSYDVSEEEITETHTYQCPWKSGLSLEDTEWKLNIVG